MSITLSPLEEINETIYNIGIWLLITGILQIMIIPLFWSLFPLFFYNKDTYSIHSAFGVMEATIFLNVTLIPLISLIAITKIRELRNISDEDLFNTGAMIVILGVMISIVWNLITIILTAIYLKNIFMHIFYSLVFLGFSYIIIFIGKILLAVAFWRFGEMNKSDIIQVGALIYVFVDFIGFIILGLTLYSTATKSREAITNTVLLTMIKDKLSKEMPRGTSIDLRDLAKGYGIAPYALIHLVKRWVMSGELEGTVSGYNYISYGTKTESW